MASFASFYLYWEFLFIRFTIQFGNQSQCSLLNLFNLICPFLSSWRPDLTAIVQVWKNICFVCTYDNTLISCLEGSLYLTKNWVGLSTLLFKLQIAGNEYTVPTSFWQFIDSSCASAKVYRFFWPWPNVIVLHFSMLNSISQSFDQFVRHSLSCVLTTGCFTRSVFFSNRTFDQEPRKYKEAIRNAHKEVRKAKKESEKSLINSKNKSNFYKYLSGRSRTKDAIGVLKDSCGNEVTSSQWEGKAFKWLLSPSPHSWRTRSAPTHWTQHSKWGVHTNSVFQSRGCLEEHLFM